MSWRCDTPGIADDNRRWYDTEAAANAEADRIRKSAGRTPVVVWEHNPTMPNQQEEVA